MYCKYAPNVRKNPGHYQGREYKYNCKGELPPPYVPGKDAFVAEEHFVDYDHEGFDSYGYSAYDKNGTYVGLGMGVDKHGYTEDDYLLDRELYESFL